MSGLLGQVPLLSELASHVLSAVALAQYDLLSLMGRQLDVNIEDGFSGVLTSRCCCDSALAGEALSVALGEGRHGEVV